LIVLGLKVRSRFMYLIISASNVNGRVANASLIEKMENVLRDDTGGVVATSYAYKRNFLKENVKNIRYIQ
jgi:hypothetical protein